MSEKKRKFDKPKKPRKKIKKAIYDEIKFSCENCPLCDSQNTKFSHEAIQRVFFECLDCGLMYVDSKCFLSLDDEKKRYDLHQNDRNDGYLRFLHLAIDPALKFLDPEGHGIDYGCGPNGILAEEVTTAGFKCESYDPFFHERELGKYDFIFSTEVWEHFRNPKVEIEKVLGCLKDDGVLTVMTELWNEKTDLKTWYYMRDPTHVCFYSAKTVKYLQDKYGLEMLFTDEKKVTIWKKLKNH